MNKKGVKKHIEAAHKKNFPLAFSKNCCRFVVLNKSLFLMEHYNAETYLKTFPVRAEARQLFFVCFTQRLFSSALEFNFYKHAEQPKHIPN